MTGSGRPWWEGHPDLLPPEPDLEPLHAREYSVRAYRLADDCMLLRGAVMDIRPGDSVAARINAAGGTDDGRPMPIHHMVVDLTVSFPDLTITGAEVVFETFPQPGCPGITAHYRELIGLSIARGFTHEVRQRFGGPRGCTHTTALLQAMAPVALQSVFSMRRVAAGVADAPTTGGPVQTVAFMRDTCHVWASDGEIWQGMLAGSPPPTTLVMQDRVRHAGLDPASVDIR
ncbi:MAG: DUF2889 domain-containing protein [Actinomycetota bacterium]|nr:DUF2889 domain-containing protein [Actinomycetota bacterium]